MEDQRKPRGILGDPNVPRPDAAALSAEAGRVARLLANPDFLLSRPEVEQLFGISARFLELAALQGGGPRITKVGRLARYRVGDLQGWIAARGIASTSQRPGAGDA